LYIQHKGETGYDLGLLYYRLAEYHKNLGNLKESYLIYIKASPFLVQNFKGFPNLFGVGGNPKELN
jgi:hypothetical protein